MKIIHSIGGHKIEKDINENENVGFLLSNGLGGYAAFSKANDSRYNGWFISLGEKLYKIIDEIKLSGEANIAKIENEFYKTERFFDNGISEKMFFPRESNSLVYELNKESPAEIVLDVREPYDGRNFGRNYEIEEEDGLIIIKYSKHKNFDEDKSEGQEYEIFLAINAGAGRFEKIGQWSDKHYEYDEKRSSQPFNRHVYRALKITAKKIIFSAAMDKKTAKLEAISVFKNANKLMSRDKISLNKLAGNLKINDEKTIVCLAAAKNSLANLMVRDGKNFGIYAGYPWFFQFWTSDEAICLKSASGIDKELARKILLRDINYINEDGKMFDVVNAKALGRYSLNMDSSGWLFNRAIEIIKDGGADKKKITNKIITVIDNLRKNYLRDGFLHSEAGETWMDTFYAGDLRDGVRIEIQALLLSMYKIAFENTGDEKYKIWEKELCRKTRKAFWNGKILADGLGDWTIRPNIFIACYIYPELLSKAEWTQCFKESLSHLWLNWGGIATIDKTLPLFYGEYTGETPESYHRGDSWYWINNLVALALYRTDANVFKDYIGKILKAGSNELLWKGFLGHISELSSANEQKSEGAWAQAWSTAMYLEAMGEIMRSEEFFRDCMDISNKNARHLRSSLQNIIDRNSCNSDEIPMKRSRTSLVEPIRINFPQNKGKYGAEISKMPVQVKQNFGEIIDSLSHIKKSGLEPRFISINRRPDRHKEILKVYEIILIIVLIFSISVALGAAVYAVSL